MVLHNYLYLYQIQSRLSNRSFPNFDVTAVPSWQLACPVVTVLYGRPVMAILSWLSSHGCLVVLSYSSSWLCCHGCPLTAVLSWHGSFLITERQKSVVKLLKNITSTRVPVSLETFVFLNKNTYFLKKLNVSLCQLMKVFASMCCKNFKLQSNEN